MQTAEQIVNAIGSLPAGRREKLIAELKYGLNRQEQVFVNEFCIDFNSKRAGAVAGYADPLRMGRAKLRMSERVQHAINEKLEEHSKASTLNAEYVRDYIKSIMDLCPTDCFVLSEDGEWCIDPESFRELPYEVKRLVESVELRMNGPRKYLTVKFVSKTTALAMAARYTLTEHIEAAVGVTQVPWEAIAERTGQSKIACIEDRIASVGKLNGEHRGEAAGPVLPS